MLHRFSLALLLWLACAVPVSGACFQSVSRCSLLLSCQIRGQEQGSIFHNSRCYDNASSRSSTSMTTRTTLRMGIFDDLQLIFSEQGRKNRAEYEAREKADMEAAQREILERRRNPEKMAEYNRQVAANRRKLGNDRQVWDFQNKVGSTDYDPLTDWQQLRKEGKIQVGSDLKRDESSRRLGSEGLFDVRIDERMPYIDQGYVDTNKLVDENNKGSNPLAGWKSIFGKKQD